jgi:putative glutamine amidotransferase
MEHALRIGLTARLMYPDPQRAVLSGKTVHYSEENAANWLTRRGAVVLVIPRLETNPTEGAASYGDYADSLDGLVLQGGSDVAPESYGEKALRPEWEGDAARDAYELAVIRAFRDLHKPILGICRGCQLLNVALGGTLYQDLETQQPGSGHHRHERLYDANFHEATIDPNTRLGALYGGSGRVTINSIHHQAIKRLAPNLAVEARSHPDGIIEAIRGTTGDYVVGVQWHPEFGAESPVELPDPSLLADEFLQACRLRRAATERSGRIDLAGT